MSSTAPQRRPAPVVAPRRPRLTLVPPLRTGAPRAPFVLLLSTLLVGGLAGLLFLHTALAEDSFRLHDLKTRSALLADREQVLEQQVAEDASPKRLAERAEALGMVHSVNPAFLRLSDGKILGKPKPGVAPPPPPAPQPTAEEAAAERTDPDAAPADSERPADQKKDDRG